MLFLYDNVAAIVVAAVASTVAWLFGGARGEFLLPVVPWLFVLLVEVLVCFPQRHRGESAYDARERVWDELRRSKVAWVSFGFLALLLIPFVNSGLCPGCDAALIAQGADPKPPFPYLPFCVNRMNHLNVVLWFMIVLPSVVAVHHCLVRRGKRLVLELIVWNGAAGDPWLRPGRDERAGSVLERTCRRAEGGGFLLDVRLSEHGGRLLHHALRPGRCAVA